METFYRRNWATFITFILLVGGFLGITQWFQLTDVYHRHFFDHGLTIFTYNLFRALFALYIIWMLYATGNAVLTFVTPSSLRLLTLSERLVFGFSTGIGLWHILLLILGIYNLYYRSVMMGLCIITLTASAKHFKDTLNEIHLPRQLSLQLLSGSVIVLALTWLLLVRGLYPSGGGDYYTHYFYYYTNVIQNHGLSPNDVWYHYYYSKGAGLSFLGMLLIDPLAPSIITFSCVAMATLALVTLINRLAPRSLWPALCATLYIFYNLYSTNGGEFQKIHEETTAIVVLAIFAVCLYDIKPKEWARTCFITLASLTICAAILTQAIAVYLGFFYGMQVVYSLIKKHWARMRFYLYLGLIATIAVISILLLNYLITGLATDQALNITWKFANLERLNQWGVLPNVIMVAWIRDNYDLVAVPWGLNSVKQLGEFMRVDALYILVFSLIVPFLLYFKIKREPNNSSLLNLGLIIVTFAILSIFVGHTQSVSYFRFSSFFFPLVTLFCVISWTFLSTQRKLSRIILPLLFLVAVIHSWSHWVKHATRATYPAMQLMVGHFSLADAYAKQTGGLPFGGIHPGAYQAVQQIPPGSRVWSTNVDSYCMAPNCQIESVISFKLSSNLNDILNGSPALSKKTLQKEGLNYFLFSKDSIIIDLLPYSHLFDPNNISKYLAIKWTDGNTYLLTWRDTPGTKPIGPSFIQLYKETLKKSAHPWFRFDKGVPQIDVAMKMIENSPHPWRPIEFPWRKPSIKTEITSHERT